MGTLGYRLMSKLSFRCFNSEVSFSSFYSDEYRSDSESF